MHHEREHEREHGVVVAAVVVAADNHFAVDRWTAADDVAVDHPADAN